MRRLKIQENICHIVVGSRFKNNGRNIWVKERIIKHEKTEVIRENI